MILIGMPMYNEGKEISFHLKNIARVMRCHDYKVLIINDGSTDESPVAVRVLSKKLPLVVYDHEINQGVGRTLNDLFIQSSHLITDGDALVTMDADGTHLAHQITELLSTLDKGYDIVIASRFAQGSTKQGVPFYRNVFTTGIRSLLTILFGIREVKDYTCGYRAYTGKIVREYVQRYGDHVIASSGFPSFPEILIRMNKIRPLKIKEIPLQLRYDLKASTSKLKLLRTIREYLRMIIRELVHP